jgi:hypothetical protein
MFQGCGGRGKNRKNKKLKKTPMGVHIDERSCLPAFGFWVLSFDFDFGLIVID